MALGDNYATLGELKTYMNLADETQFDALLSDALDSSSREIEKFCKRQFNDAGAATARVFDPVSPRRVFVHDFHTTTGFVLKTDEDDDGVFEKTWTAADYELRPLGGVRSELTGWPYWEIRATGRNGLTFPKHEAASVEATARWGWSAVPEPVRRACLILAAKTHNMKDAPLGVAGMGEFGVVRVVDDRVAAAKLRHYMKRILVK